MIVDSDKEMALPLRRELLAIIPARGGSKGIPKKNLVELQGHPLIVHTIKASLQSNSVTRTIVSTDDEEIGAVVCKEDVEILRRPEELSQDWSSSLDVIQHCLTRLIRKSLIGPNLLFFFIRPLQ